ncbi:hypothetical protein KKE60_05940 [Patescibacteria group bacterium]|nr:hypothetical protein [Patescibacteria group bacterium]
MAYDKMIGAKITQDQYDRLFLHCATEKLDISEGLRKLIDSLPATPEQIGREIARYEEAIALLKKKKEAQEKEVKEEKPKDQKKEKKRDEMDRKTMDLIRRIKKKYPVTEKREEKELKPIIKEIDEEIGKIITAMDDEFKRLALRRFSMVFGYYFESKEQGIKLTENAEYFFKNV